MQQVGEGQRGQRVPTQIGELRVGLQVGGGRAQQGAGGPADGFQHRPVGAALAQRPQLVGLAVGQVGVELLEPLAVVLLELGPRQLADAGQQTVLEGERRCLDDEVARDLVRLQVGRARRRPSATSLIQRLEAATSLTRQRVFGRARRRPADTSVRCCRRRRSGGPAGCRRIAASSFETVTNSPCDSFSTLLRRSTY